LVPSWLGALLSGAFLKIWCGVAASLLDLRLAVSLLDRLCRCLLSSIAARSDIDS
jgi:hypothetical protein